MHNYDLPTIFLCFSLILCFLLAIDHLDARNRQIKLFPIARGYGLSKNVYQFALVLELKCS